MSYIRFIIPGLFLLLAACKVGPNYTPPEIHSNKNWATPTDSKIVTIPIKTNWWLSFQDPLLTSYIQKATCSNLSFQMAKMRILEARAMRGVAIANFYPQIDTIDSAQSIRISKQGQMLGFIPNFPGINLIKRQRGLYNLGFDAEWEIDFFGKTQRKLESSNAQIGQSIEAARDVLITMQAELGRNYIEMRGAQQDMHIIESNIKLQKKTLAITEKQYEAGMGNAMDVALAKSNLQKTQAKLPGSVAQVLASAYRLAALLGEEPQVILKDIDTNFIPKLPTKPVPIGLRSDVLKRRPDVREAERQLASSSAEIGVAIADLYPQFSLTGDIGLQSVFLNTLFNGSNALFTLGPTVSWPIFHGGRILSNISSKRARAKHDWLNFKQTMLDALSDVESSLTRYNQSLKTKTQLIAAVKTNKDAVTLAKLRYENGEDNILALVYSEQQLNDAENALNRNNTDSLLNLVSLYKSLGGGWEDSIM